MGTLPFKQIDVFGKANEGLPVYTCARSRPLLASLKIRYAAAVTPR